MPRETYVPICILPNVVAGFISSTVLEEETFGFSMRTSTITPAPPVILTCASKPVGDEVVVVVVVVTIVVVGGDEKQSSDYEPFVKEY